MAQQQNGSTFVPIFVSQDEYNEIMKQPPYMHQQLLQQLHQKQQQQNQQPQYQQQHPYLQQQYQQPQQQSQILQIPPIPTHPDQHPYLRQPNYQPPQEYTPQQQIHQQLIQPQQEVVTLVHRPIQKAGLNETKFFNQSFAHFLALQNALALILNLFSTLFGFKITTGYNHWDAGFWVVLSLFIVLNLFILTSPKFVVKDKNQQVLFVIHTILYMLVMQGFQTAISGYSYYYYGDVNYFFYFYSTIVLEIITVSAIVKKKGVDTPLKQYLPFLIVPAIVPFLIEIISCSYYYFYIPLFIWIFVAILFAIGEIQLIKRINSVGYNNYRTSDAQAVAMNFIVLLASPIYDLE